MISIIIPTFKQKYLESTLTSLRSQNTNLDFEIIVVENGEQNNLTKELCQIYSCRYFFIEEIGANNARNFGIKNSMYDFIGLVDDDIILTKTWLNEFQLSIKNSEFSILSGPVLLNFSNNPPDWIQLQLRTILAEVKIEDYLPVQTSYPFFIKPSSGFHVVSANMIFNKNEFNREEIFDVDFGYKGKELLTPNDETLLIDEAFETNGILYNPKLKVNHIIDKDKMKINYFEKRFYGQGYSDVFIHMKRMNCDVNESWQHILETKFDMQLVGLDPIYLKAYSNCKIEYFKGVKNAVYDCLQSEDRKLPFDEIIE